MKKTQTPRIVCDLIVKKTTQFFNQLPELKQPLEPNIPIQQIKTLKKGTKLKKLGEVNDYFRVQTEKDDIGFIKCHHVGKLSALNLQLDQQATQFTFPSIGYIESIFPDKNGCPRQGSVVEHSRGKLILTLKQADQLLDGLQDFSHVWLIFVFHKNTSYKNVHKIRPPRLDGERIGIFATRTPHRPNPIGLTVAKIEGVEGNVVHLSALDLIDGTPILDIKPYIPYCDALKDTKIPDWLEKPVVKSIPREKISFTDESEMNLKKLVPHLKFYKTFDEIKNAIIEILQTDPRPVYVRKKRLDRLYGIRVDTINIRCKIDEEDNIQIVEVELWDDEELEEPKIQKQENT